MTRVLTDSSIHYRQVQRDGFHPARRHRGEQAEGDHAQGGQLHQGVEDEGPGYLRLGDQRQVARRRHLRQVQRPLRLLHQQGCMLSDIFDLFHLHQREIQASPPLSVTVSGELLTVSLYPNIFIV